MSEQSLNGGFKFETFPVIRNRICSEYESIITIYLIDCDRVSVTSKRELQINISIISYFSLFTIFNHYFMAWEQASISTSGNLVAAACTYIVHCTWQYVSILLLYIALYDVERDRCV
jgi:hypothetical protein